MIAASSAMIQRSSTRDLRRSNTEQITGRLVVRTRSGYIRSVNRRRQRSPEGVERGLEHGLLYGIRQAQQYGISHGLRYDYNTVCKTAYSMACYGLQDGLLYGLQYGLQYGLRHGLLYGLPYGLLYGLLYIPQNGFQCAYIIAQNTATTRSAIRPPV